MKKIISKVEFDRAEKRMNEILEIATQGGGFDSLSDVLNVELENVSKIVELYEDAQYVIGSPKNLTELLLLKMYEKRIKQVELAAILHMSEPSLSKIMSRKVQPSIKVLKSIKNELEVDGNLLLSLVD